MGSGEVVEVDMKEGKPGFTFEDLDVWKKARVMRNQISQIANTFKNIGFQIK